MKRIVISLTLIAVVSALLGAAAAFAVRSADPPVGAGVWHTSGTTILDANDRSVRIAAVTWYGMESTYWVPAGLDYQPFTSIMDLVKKMGFNAIRLPFSNQLVEQDPVVTQKIAANPQFRGVHAMQVMDAIVSYAQQIGLKIILDDHRSIAATPKRVNYLDEGLWYTPQYPPSAWIHDWQTLAQRYLHNDAVIGFDLRNEPHTNGPGPWTTHAYLDQGATWGPFEGADNPATDWRLASEAAGNAVLAINPHLLIFVEGVQLFPAGVPGHVNSYWWGSILSPVAQYPVVLNVPHQLVYSAHDWGPFKWKMPWFRSMSYTSLQRVWHANWSFLLDHPNSSSATPLWLGEFGTCTTRATCVDDIKPGNQAQWFHFLLRFLREHPNVGWSFFALNGTNSNDHVADNGLLNPQWSGPRNPALIADLARIQPSHTSGISWP